MLKQAEASLAAFIGCVNYSDTFTVAAAIHRESTIDDVPSALAEEVPANMDTNGSNHLPQANALFDQSRISDVRNHANMVTKTYGYVSVCTVTDGMLLFRLVYVFCSEPENHHMSGDRKPRILGLIKILN